MRYSDVDDAVRRANDSPYGLTASVWSADHDGAVAVACRLEASAICSNTHNAPPADVGLSLAKLAGTGWRLGAQGIVDYLATFTVIPFCQRPPSAGPSHVHGVSQESHQLANA